MPDRRLTRAFTQAMLQPGLSPGTLVFTGEKKVDEVKITVFDFDEEHLEEKVCGTVDECLEYRDRPTITWINIDGLHRVDLIDKIGKHYGLHPLLLEDVLSTNHRPKIEDHGDHVFFVLKQLQFEKEKRHTSVEQFSMVLGKNFVITFQENVGDVLDPVRLRLRGGKGRIRKSGADYIAYAIIDAIVDEYFVIQEHVGEAIETIEDELLLRPNRKTVTDIHDLKREMIWLRKSVWPLREAISRLERGESSLIRPANRIYFRDVYDHTVQVIDLIETFRELLAGMLEMYLSSVSNRLNEVMKVLTIITTIFIPLTFVTSIYGMNFKHMPEIPTTWGYPTVLAIMAGIAGTMVYFFRKKRWI